MSYLKLLQAIASIPSGCTGSRSPRRRDQVHRNDAQRRRKGKSARANRQRIGAYAHGTRRTARYWGCRHLMHARTVREERVDDTRDRGRYLVEAFGREYNPKRVEDTLCELDCKYIVTVAA